MSYFRDSVLQQLSRLSSEHQRRHLFFDQKPTGGQKVKVDLSHNDYLNLSDDLHLRARILGRVEHLAVGSRGSRLLGGDHEIFHELEQKFAVFKGSTSSLFFGSGFLANLAVMRAFDSIPSVHFFSDAMNHASIIDGLRLSKHPKEVRKIYAHLDYADLESKLENSDANLNVIVTESLFGMDGDCADVDVLYGLAKKYRAILVIDEAHAVGVYGAVGEGKVSRALASEEHVITVNPCGKAFAAQGAFVTGASWWREHLVNHARSFIYATAPSPWIAAALLEIIESVRNSSPKRAHLEKISNLMRRSLCDLDISSVDGDSHIIPAIVFNAERALNMANSLLQRGIRCPAIRWPTVAKDAARLRLSMHAGVSEEQVVEVSRAIKSALT